jgi:hypothetical protein
MGDLYTECPRRNVPDFGRVFLMLKYTDITQNTYVQSWTVTEIMARETRHTFEGRTPLNDQLVTETTTYTTHKHKRRTSMPSAGFQPVIPAIKQLSDWCIRPHGLQGYCQSYLILDSKEVIVFLFPSNKGCWSTTNSIYLRSSQVVRQQELCKIHITESACVRTEKLPESEIFTHPIPQNFIVEISLISRMHMWWNHRVISPPSRKNVGVYPLSLAN